MINAKMVKILGLVATAVGMGATLLPTGERKEKEEKIDDCLKRKASPQLNDEEEES